MKSGDSDNREGIAARLYWGTLFGEDFIRNREEGGINALLNYGYAVLRAATARALVSAGALAFGVIITALTSGFNIDVYNYMFGSILTMTKTDVIISIVLSVLLVIAYMFFYNRLFMITYDEKYAKVCGINVTFYQFLIALFTALVVVIGMRMMGTLLISSLIVFPAIIARKITHSFKGMAIMSVIISILCFLFGLIASSFLNLPTGASIVMVYIGVLLFSIVWSKVVKT